MLVSRTYVRNDAGEPTRITHEDGSYTEVDYDPAGRVEAERYFDAVDTLLETVTYGYDLDGNRTGRTSNAGTEVYEYDTGSRLMRVTLDGVETQRFEYDNNGRVTRIVRDGLDQRLTWDALDRLVRVEDQNFLEDPIDFAYDGQGRRVAADHVGTAMNRYVVGPTGNQSLESPHLVHNGLFLTGELVYNGEHALWRYDGAEPPETRIYLRDAMGSVIGLMDDGGNLVESFDYDAFGNVRSAGGEALPEVNLGGDSRFQGMWKDAGTGLYYVRARYYDPRTGRFLSRDPEEGVLDEAETLQPYVFGNNSPHIFIDPTGESFVGVNDLVTTLNVLIVVTGITTSVQTFGLLGKSRTGLPIVLESIPVELDATLLVIDVTSHLSGFLTSLDVWLNKAKDAGKNDPHGDAGRALEKSTEKIRKLTDKIDELKAKPRTKKITREIKQLGQKIRNIVRDAQKKAKGETHHRR